MKSGKPVVIGCDHAGTALKWEIIRWLDAHGYKTVDCGCGGSCSGGKENETADYPDIALEVCKKIKDESSELGILICGTGVGISMAANKLDGIRAANCNDYFSAKYTRLHNDANVLCMGARVIGPGLACELVNVFLTAEFEGGRHVPRVKKIMELEHYDENCKAE